MQKVKFKPGTQERMREILQEAKTAPEVKRVQCVLFGSLGASSDHIGAMVGFNPQYVKVVWKKYRKEGEKALIGERRGKARGRALLSEKEEEAFLTPFFDQAGQAGILFVTPLHHAYEKKVGKKVHLASIYKLLARHGWRKIVPRKYHPKADKEKQETFRDFFPHSNSHG